MSTQERIHLTVDEMEAAILALEDLVGRGFVPQALNVTKDGTSKYKLTRAVPGGAVDEVFLHLDGPGSLGWRQGTEAVDIDEVSGAPLPKIYRTTARGLSPQQVVTEVLSWPVIEVAP